MKHWQHGMRWTQQQYNDYLAKRNQAGGKAPSSESEHSPIPALATYPEAKERHSGKRLVRITCFRVRKQDPDNGIYKFHVDAIRAAGLIPDDTEDDIELQTSQVQVKTKDEERTEIVIERLWTL